MPICYLDSEGNKFEDELNREDAREDHVHVVEGIGIFLTLPVKLCRETLRFNIKEKVCSHIVHYYPVHRIA